MGIKKINRINSLLLIAVIFIFESCSHPNERHIGEWKNIDKDETTSLILDKSNHAILMVNNTVLGGKGFEIKGVKTEVKYEIDYSKSPIWLDLVFYVQGEFQEKGRVKGIIQFITDNKILYRISLNLPDKRFDKFDTEDKENTIVFDKVTN
jgi:hypothetical protein